MSDEAAIKDMNAALVEGHDIVRLTDNNWTQRNPKPRPSWRDHAFTAKQLQSKHFPEIKYVVPDLLPEGLSLLAGRPKIGKSWFALDVAIAVAGGRVCLGDLMPESGDVLYCALEDNERRLKKRIAKILGSKDALWPDRLTFSTSWPRLREKGEQYIEEWAKSVPNPRLVVLDVLASVLPITTKDGYAQDYLALTKLHRLANDRAFGVLALHHQRKGEAEDPLDTVSGTLGIVGCADTTLILASGNAGKTLYVRGRDIEEAEHAIEFDAALCRWRILGSADDIRRSETRRKILAALASNDTPMGPKEIASASGLREEVVRQRLGDMLEDSQVIKVSHGKYTNLPLQ